MPDPFTILGCIGTSLAIIKHLISAIDLIEGARTHNSQAAALWSEALSDLKTELIHARDQLVLVKSDIEPMRAKQGPSADAVNLKRKALEFDDLVMELKNELEESGSQFRSASEQFEQKGFFNWVLLAAFDTRVREVVAPIKRHTRELRTVRQRVHAARESIMTASVEHYYHHTGGGFPTPETFGGTTDRLALNFLWPEPFCSKFGFEDSLSPGLLLCNGSGAALQELYDRIQKMGMHWVRGVRREASDPDADSPVPTLDVLEKCQNIMLAQLDKGIFESIIEGDSLFATTDRMDAIHGRCTIHKWRSIWLGGGSGIMIALGGKMSAGKSSIINAMLGRPLLPVASMFLAQFHCLR